MRGFGGVGGHMLLEYDQKVLLKDDHDHKTLFGCFHGFHNDCVDTNINDKEDHNFDDCDDDLNINSHAVDSDDSNNDDEPFNLNERTIFWESQEALLQEILEQYSLSGSKLREEISRVIDLAKETKFCECLGRKLDSCSNCLRRRVVNLLCKKGFNASLCTSIWKKTHTTPGGKHEYIDVVVSTQGKRRKIRFLIEIDFRDEFMMPKACDKYTELIHQLPESYIGKPEHLNAVVRVICDAAKRSTSERKIHLGPWRKRSFVQMKWSTSCESRHIHQFSSSSKLD